MQDYLQKKFNQKKNDQNFARKKPIYLFNLAILLGIVCFSIIYFLQINNISSKGYQIRDLEKDIAVLKDENKILELDIIKLQSIQNIKEKTASMELITPDNIEYITLTSASMAKR